MNKIIVDLPVAILRFAFGEMQALTEHLICYYPESLLGSRLRRWYWSKKTNTENIKYVGRGVVIRNQDVFSCGANLVLGQDVKIDNGNSHGIFIGSGVGLARGSYIRTANHSTLNTEISWQEQGHEAKSIEHEGSIYSVVIEDDVWVGASSIILSGAHIGKGSVVAAGTVISGAIPPYSIIVGNPGRVIGNRKKITSFKLNEGLDIG